MAIEDQALTPKLDALQVEELVRELKEKPRPRSLGRTVKITQQAVEKQNRSENMWLSYFRFLIYYT